MLPPVIIEQGTTRTVVIGDITARGPDGTKVALDVTGWAVRAVARDSATGTEVLAEWTSGTPTGTQGQASAVGGEVHLHVTPAMSRAWTWAHARLHVSIIEPTEPFREERIGDVTVVNDFTTVR